MMKQHLNNLGWLYIIYNSLTLLTTSVIIVAITSGVIIGDLFDHYELLLVAVMVIASFVLILSLPGIIGGIFLLKMQNWARILVLILGFLNLFNFPLGTALGIYTLWVLFKDETIALFHQAELHSQSPSGQR
jgi:hypothetical protein